MVDETLHSLLFLFRSVCRFGNYDVGIREGSYLGTTVVNIGTRERQRERGKNVLDVGHDAGQIAEAVMRQVKKGKYSVDNLDGDGSAGKKIADILAKCSLNITKEFYYAP